ncbi:MAG: hypothetical protein GXX94_01425 [Chloroflexi bacterium]|nr:hypothetical protein [Chloroflexota bacterium]
MRIVLGLDIGTTSLSAVAFDADEQRVVTQAVLPNRGALYEDLPGGLLGAELDLAIVHDQLIELLGQIAAALPDREAVRAIGLTGQQHGMALFDEQLYPAGRAITWQDQRTLCPYGSGTATWLEAFVAEAGGEGAFVHTGCRPAAGFMGPSLYWVLRQASGPRQFAHACLIPDAAFVLLTGCPPVTDVTDGASSGLVDIVHGEWAWEIIERLKLPPSLFPPIHPAGLPFGTLDAAISRVTGLPRVPVCVAAGDNQASFAGSVRDPGRSVLVNVGTGGQVSVVIPTYGTAEGLETRAYFGGLFLLVGAGLYGGRAYAYLRSFFESVGQTIYDMSTCDDLYGRMNKLAEATPPGADGLRCRPLFTGTRTNPDTRASLTGIGPTNFTPGHLARALLEGIAEGFGEMYAAMRPLSGGRSTLVGAGNGLTLNPLLAAIVADRFDLPLHLAGTTEAAALGAALLAANGAGILSIEEGSRSIVYDRVIQPETP